MAASAAAWSRYCSAASKRRLAIAAHIAEEVTAAAVAYRAERTRLLAVLRCWSASASPDPVPERGQFARLLEGRERRTVPRLRDQADLEDAQERGQAHLDWQCRD